MQVNRLSDALGAEVTGIDVASVSDDDFDAIHAAWLEHEVLVLRDQELTPEQHIAFSKRFGDLEVHISVDHLLEGYPEIMMVSNKQENGRFIGAVSAGDYWHSDLSCNAHPTKASLLYSLELPSFGGDTEWADMYAAYETLPEKTKQRIQGLSGIHSWNRMRNPRVHVPEVHNDDAEMRYGERAPDDSLHPIVRTHPETGRKALYVSPRFTLGVDGLENDEAQELLGELFAHQARRDFVFHHKWSLGDLVLWDNRCTVHFACGGHTETRHMHRTSVAGDVPF
ncbi:MAG: taurine dioxygenase [Alphaproteobacteria bacterium]|jgi:taurine dioxygenase